MKGFINISVSYEKKQRKKERRLNSYAGTQQVSVSKATSPTKAVLPSHPLFCSSVPAFSPTPHLILHSPKAFVQGFSSSATSTSAYGVEALLGVLDDLQHFKPSAQCVTLSTAIFP